jgi:hypothetical protein
VNRRGHGECEPGHGKRGPSTGSSAFQAEGERKARQRDQKHCDDYQRRRRHARHGEPTHSPLEGVVAGRPRLRE